MNNERFLGILVILFIIGATVYIGVNKLKQEVKSATASPSPGPAALDFVLLKSPGPGQPQASGLPLAKNKRLAGFPGIVPADTLKTQKAVITTSKGLIELELYP